MTEAQVLVQNMVEKFQTKGLEVLYANCEGYKDPTEIRGAVPDVVGWDPNKEIYHLGLIEGSSDVLSDSTIQKITVLAGMMMSTGTSEGKRLPFYLGYPKESTKQIDERFLSIETTTQENIERVEI